MYVKAIVALPLLAVVPYTVVGKIWEVQVHNFRDSAKLPKLLFREMTSPKWDNAAFELNCQVLTVKSLILNEIVKFSSVKFYHYLVHCMYVCPLLTCW